MNTPYVINHITDPYCSPPDGKLPPLQDEKMPGWLRSMVEYDPKDPGVGLDLIRKWAENFDARADYREKHYPAESFFTTNAKLRDIARQMREYLDSPEIKYWKE